MKRAERTAISFEILTNLADIAKERGWPAFRLRQIHHAREVELKTAWHEIATLPKQEREFLAAHVPFDALTQTTEQISADGTAVKWLLRAADGAEIETVLLLHTGAQKKWGTVCVSCQVGCPVGCKFCATGTMGLTRNLTTAEILDQFLLAKRAAAARGLTSLNIVFMGMGEPLLNLPAVLPALKILTDPTRFALSPSRITISTSGVVPGLRELFASEIRVGLALSLHAPNDELRTQLMPINAHFPLAEVLAELRKWEARGTEILIEYVLLKDVNDQPEHARALARLLAHRHVKINLIPLNPVAGSNLARPDRQTMRDFLAILEKAGLAATLRHTKGDDIAAACGQLRTTSQNPSAKIVDAWRDGRVV